MGKLSKKAILICALLSMLVCHLSLAPVFGGTAPHSALCHEGIDVDHTDSVLRQEWGLVKSISVSMRPLSASVSQIGAIAQHRLFLSEPYTDGIFSTFGVRSAASGQAYLNNLSLRC